MTTKIRVFNLEEPDSNKYIAVGIRGEKQGEVIVNPGSQHDIYLHSGRVLHAREITLEEMLTFAELK